MQYIAINAITN